MRTPLSCLALGATLVITLIRLRFGVDFSDEPFYLAQTYRFILGDRPFVEDHLLLSTLSFVTEPLLKLFLGLRLGLDGAILYFRLWHYLLSLLTAIVIFDSLKTWFQTHSRILIACIPIAYLHHQMPTLSYNTMALHFASIAIFSSVPGLVLGQFSPARLVLSSVSATVMAIVYPPLALPALLLFLAILKQAAPRNTFQWASLILPPCLLGVGFSLWINHEWSQIVTVIAATKSAGGAGGLPKLYDCLTGLVSYTPHKTGLIVLGILTFHAARLPKSVRLFLALFLAIVPMVLSRHTSLTGGVSLHGLGYVYYWACLSWWFVFLIRREIGMIAKILFPWGALCGLTTAWASSYGLSVMGFVIGIFPLSVLGIAAYGRWCEITLGTRTHSAALLLVLGALFYYQLLPFKDDPISQLRTQITAGPFQGLFTSAVRAADEARFRSDVARFAHPNGKLFVLESMPVLYLYSSMRPAARVLYKTCMEGRIQCRDHYQNQIAATNLVIHVKPAKYNLDVLSSIENFLSPDDPVLALIRQTHPIVLENTFYTFYSGTK